MYERFVLGVGISSRSERSSEQSQLAQSGGERACLGDLQAMTRHRAGVSGRSIKTRYRVRNSRLRGGLPVTRVRLAHQRRERGRNRRPVMRTRLETSIQHLVEIPPAVEAPAFRLGEDITRLNLRLYLSTAWGHIIARHLLWLTSDDRYYCHHNHHHRYKQSNVIT